VSYNSGKVVASQRMRQGGLLDCRSKIYRN
jgi:hypothetical protein